MNQITNILTFVFISLLSYFFTASSLSIYTPQLIALISIVFIILLFKKHFSIHLIAFVINLIIFSSTGLNSPYFFLVYFLLFTIAFQNPPTTTLSYSLALIVLLSQSLNSVQSLIPLSSLLFITPLAYFIGRQHLEKDKIETDLIQDETSTLLWLSLKFKMGISQVIDTTSQLLSSPLLPSQKEKVRHIQKSAKSLLSSSKKLTEEIDSQTDDD